MSGEADDGMGDDVYQPDGSEVGTDQGILDAEDTLDDRGVDPYDEGWSPPERPWEVERFGTTAAEQRDGESLDQRLAEEVPDPALEAPDEWADTLGDASDTDGELLDGEVGNRRAGRLVGQDKETTNSSPRTSASTARRPRRRKPRSIWWRRRTRGMSESGLRDLSESGLRPSPGHRLQTGSAKT